MSNEIDEEKMKKFDELHQKVIEKMKECDKAEKDFFDFVHNLKGIKFKFAKDQNKLCKIQIVFYPKWILSESGYVNHERLNFDRHWYSKSKTNSFADFCIALRKRNILILKKDEDNYSL